MTWLRKRLRQLGLTHQDLTDRLAKHGIAKSRPTVSNWINGQPIPLLMVPEDTEVLAKVLDWNVSEMLIAAEYPIVEEEIPMEVATYLERIRALDENEREFFYKTMDFALELIHKGYVGGNKK